MSYVYKLELLKPCVPNATMMNAVSYNEQLRMALIVMSARQRMCSCQKLIIIIMWSLDL